MTLSSPAIAFQLKSVIFLKVLDCFLRENGHYSNMRTATKTKTTVETDPLWIEFQNVFEDIKKGRIHPWKPRTIPDTR